MAKKIVALYDNLAEAQSAAADLRSAGFSQSQVKLIGSDDVGEYSNYVDSKGERLGGREKEGFFSNLWNSLFGSGVSEEYAYHYGEGARRGGTIVTVDTSEDLVDEATRIMNRHNPVDMEERASQWREEGWTGYSQTRGTRDIASESTRRHEDFRSSRLEGHETRIPVAEEEINIGKRQVDTGGVRVHTYVEKEPVEKEVSLKKERVHVERHPVDRKVDESELERAFRDEDFELKETEEEPVISKQARVVEEVSLRKDVEGTSETVRDTVRRTKVDVDQEGREAGRSFDTDRDYFEKDYNSRYAQLGGTYEDYLPAYRYGHGFASDMRYKGRRWEEMEPEIRSRWESEHRGTWEKFKDAVRHGWNRVTGST